MRALVVVAFFLAANAWGDEATLSSVMPDTRGNWPVELGFGLQMEFHKTVEATSYEPVTMPVLQVGVYQGRWLYSLDVFFEKNESQSGSLSIASERQSLDLWVTRMSQMRASWTQY